MNRAFVSSGTALSGILSSAIRGFARFSFLFCSRTRALLLRLLVLLVALTIEPVLLLKISDAVFDNHFTQFSGRPRATPNSVLGPPAKVGKDVQHKLVVGVAVYTRS